MSITAMKQAVEHMEWSTPQGRQAYWGLVRAIAEAEEQEPVAWLTKELMADYLDMIAEAIETNRSEMLRHKAHWMRVRGEV